MYKTIVTLLILIFISQSANAKFYTIENFKIPDDIPFFDVDNKKHYLDQYEEKALLVTFWATWSSPCQKILPDLDLLKKDFKNLKFDILAISEDFQSVDIIKDFYKKYDIRYLEIFHDYKNNLFKEFNIVGIPTSILINFQEKTVLIFTGEVNWHSEEVRNLLLKHIPGCPPIPKNSYKGSFIEFRHKAIE